MKNDNIFNDQDNTLEGILEDSNIPFEPLYQDIKENPNDVWFLFEERMQKICKNLAYIKYFDYDELIQEAYLAFLHYAKVYDPYYCGNFYPFHIYIRSRVTQLLRAHIQHTRFKANRESCTDFIKLDRNSSKNVEYQNDELLADDYNLEDDLLFNQSLQAFLKTLNKDERFIFTETLNGTKQAEIGEKLHMKQSRVSVILKNIRIKYLTYFNMNKNEFKSKAIKNLDVEKYIRQEKRKERNRRRLW